MNFYTILTAVGEAKISNAIALQQQVNWTEIAIGDGGGSYPTISRLNTALTNEVYRGDIIDFSKDLPQSNWLQVDGYVPSNVGDWYVREVGIYDSDGDLVAIGVYPETYKPSINSGVAKDLLLKIVVEVSSTEVVNITIDPAIVIASREWVDARFAEEKVVKKRVNTDYLAKHHEDLLIDTTGGIVTVTLPQPADGLRVSFLDLKSSFETNKLIISRSSEETIMGLPQDMDVDKSNISFTLECMEIETNLFDWRIR